MTKKEDEAKLREMQRARQCPVAHCPYEVPIYARDPESVIIAHLTTYHGWSTLLRILRDGCQFDCETCHPGEEDE